MNSYARNKGELFKSKCLTYKSSKCCKRCSRNWGALRSFKFHHYKGGKDFNVSQGMYMPWSIVKKELDKCVTVCGNCHDDIHEFDIKFDGEKFKE